MGIFGNDIAASKGENVGQIFQLSIFFYIRHEAELTVTKLEFSALTKFGFLS